MNLFVLGEAIRESVSQTRMADALADTGSQPRFEEHDRASQSAARLIRNGQARRAMLVGFPTYFFNPLARTTTNRQGLHDLFDAHLRSAPVISRHAATHVALGDDADQLVVFCILNHRLRSRSLNHASRARRLQQNLAGDNTKMLRSVSSHRYSNSFSLLPSCSAQRFI